MCLSVDEKAYHRVAIVTSFLSWQQLIFVTQVRYSLPRQLINQLCSGFLAAKKEEMTFFKHIQMLITRCFYFALGY